MKQLLHFLMLLPLVGQSQVAGSGIQWVEGLNWEQVQEKAARENKYIFLDCFTTWCGPCKKMDQVVYTDPAVGAYLNEHFISVKVQMDKTKNDNEWVKSWYGNAEAIIKKYRIEGYPCFIFFSPQGTIVHKDMGYKDPPAFVTLSQTAAKPGKVYVDPYAEYDKLVGNYKQGIKDYEKMIGMIKTAEKLGDQVLSKQLLNDHTDYVATLPKEQRYTKESIKLWSDYILNSTGKRFQFFYEDGDLIDKIMNETGYAARVVDKTIFNEIVSPFLSKQPGGEVMAQNGMGMMWINTATGLQVNKEGMVDYREANWKALQKTIRKNFNAACARRNILEARLQWYQKHNNWTQYARYYLVKLERNNGDDFINNSAFDIFMHVTDKKLLNQLIVWVEPIVKQYGGAGEIDTYANLLYKVGRTKEAIEWEEKAANMEARFQQVVEQMKKGEPTYGALWN